MSDLYYDHLDYIKELRSFYPNIPLPKQKESKETLHILKNAIGEIFELNPDNITGDRFDGFMLSWRSRVKDVIGAEIYNGIERYRKNHNEIFTDSVYSDPKFDAKIVTALWLFKNLPVRVGSSEVTVGMLLPMVKSRTESVTEERQTLFKALLELYQYEALTKKLPELSTDIIKIVIRRRELEVEREQLINDINRTRTTMEQLRSQKEALKKEIDKSKESHDVLLADENDCRETIQQIEERQRKLLEDNPRLAAHQNLKAAAERARETYDNNKTDANRKAWRSAQMRVTNSNKHHGNEFFWAENKLKKLQKARDETQEELDDILNNIRTSGERLQMLNEDYAQALKNFDDAEHEYIRADDEYTQNRIIELREELEDMSRETPPERIFKRIKQFLSEEYDSEYIDKEEQDEAAIHYFEEQRQKRLDEAAKKLKAKHPDLDEWIKEHTFDKEKVIEIVDQIEKDIKAGKEIQLSEYTNAVREELSKRFPSIAKDILSKIPANGTVQLEISSIEGKVRRVNMNYDKLRKIFDKWIEEGFEFKFEDFDEHMPLTEGDRNIRCPVWMLRSFSVKSATGPHAPGGNFCPYLIRSEERRHVVKYCRERLQIYDHIPRGDEPELLEPCFIHSVICGLKRPIRTCFHDATERQKSILRELLYSRIRTRFVPLSGLHKICGEFGLELTISDLNGTELLHLCPKDKVEYKASIFLWNDHFFVDEKYGNVRTNDLVRGLDLVPMTKAESYIYEQRLPKYEPHILNYVAGSFKTAKQLLEEPDMQFEGVTKIPARDLSVPTEDNAPFYAYNLFLKYLVDKQLDVLADSSIVKAFIRQSVHPGMAILAYNEPQIPNEPVSMLDVNSAYPNAEAQVNVPLGKPRTITSSMTWDDVLSKPCFVVEATIVKYNGQHELDRPMLGKHVLNNIDFQYLPIEIDKSIAPRGFYWINVAEHALDEFVDQLFAIKQQNKSLGKALLNQHIGMFARRAPLTHTVFAPFKDLKSHPLIKDSRLEDNGQYYNFYHEYDYTYNFTMLYSLILSQAKANNEKLFRYCHSNNIPMYYSSTDSIAVPTRCLPMLKEFMDDKELGKLKIEAQGDHAMFIAYGLYYVNDNKYSAQFLEHEKLEAYCSKNNISIQEFFERVLQDRSLLARVNRIGLTD